MAHLDMRAGAAQRHAPALSPRFQHAVRLLHMSSVDFAATVRELLGKNPFLEFDEGGEGEADVDASADDRNDEAVGDTGSSDEGDREQPGLPQADDRDLWSGDIASTRDHHNDSGVPALDLTPGEVSLRAHLHGQLNVLPLPWRDLVTARMVVESLDDDGYLRTPLEDLADRPGLVDLYTPPALDELLIALRRVQSLDPSGVGARSVAECLTLQLPAITCPPLRGLAAIIIERHLPLLAKRDASALARAMGQPPELVQAASDRIRRLDPRPGWRFGSSRVDHVVPDVTVTKLKGRWTVQLNPAIVPRLRVNEVYAELFRRHRTARDGAMADHLQEARWTLRNVEQRFATIVDVAEAIVRHQAFFLDFGPMAMKPLGLRDIAGEIGMHESTVSRVTHGKYMATPSGVFELKTFFSRAMVSANGSACSGTAIRSLMSDLIAAEEPASPLSDADITRLLAQQGLSVARRTVTKYRQLLRIEPVDRRRRLG